MAEEFKVKSEASKRNRNEGQHKSHCCGSSNLAVHAAKLKKERQGPISEVDVYRATHTRKNGQLIDDFLRGLLEMYDENVQRLRMQASHGDGTELDSETLCDAKSTSALQCEAWLASVGGPRRGRILGYGPRLRANTTGSRDS